MTCMSETKLTCGQRSVRQCLLDYGWASGRIFWKLCGTLKDNHVAPKFLFSVSLFLLEARDIRLKTFYRDLLGRHAQKCYIVRIVNFVPLSHSFHGEKLNTEKFFNAVPCLIVCYNLLSGPIVRRRPKTLNMLSQDVTPLEFSNHLQYETYRIDLTIGR